MRMLLKCAIGGSGDVGAAEAPQQSVKTEIEVAVAADVVSLYLDIVDGVVLPQPDPEVHTDSSDDSGDDSNDEPDDHSCNDSNNDRQLDSHLYPFMFV
ncbi:E3 ubiquitin-protein ligase [Hordeum vulgare]|nr:E3 ubiquitin-protein ligase [Hordeum vulgare]